MSGETNFFDTLCQNAKNGKREKISCALKDDSSLINQVDYEDNTLLIWACKGRKGNIMQIQDLLLKGSNINARNKWGYDALMTSFHELEVVDFLLSKGANPDSKNIKYSALTLAARYNNLQICLMLLKYNANLMMVVDGRTALDIYGEGINPKLSLDEIRQCRDTLQAAFVWARRWPAMNVIVGCGFRPLDPKLRELKRQRDLLIARGELPSPTILDTLERRRAYYMGLILGSDELCRLIISFL
jgi:ankyrin repeat protein